MVVGVIGWIVLGMIAGLCAGRLLNKRGEAHSFDIFLGMAGAVSGGWLFTAAAGGGMTELNLWSLVIAVVGAVTFLAVWHAMRPATLQL